MSLEEALNRNSEALEAHTAALLGKGSPVTAKGGTKGGAKTAPTFDEVKAIAERVMDEKGTPAAKALIAKHGAKKLAELDKSKFAAFIAACEVVLNTEAEPEPEDDEI